MTDLRASFLRSNQTIAERRLWQKLQSKRCAGRRFRRQFRLGAYIVDFVCLSDRLVVEVDGESHNHTIARDEERSRWIESQGFRIVRFTNDDVRYRLEGVVQMIEAEILGATVLKTEQKGISPT
jgi:very-short-patch-repair endonuclease